MSSMEFLTSNKAEKMLTNFTKGYIKDVWRGFEGASKWNLIEKVVA